MTSQGGDALDRALADLAETTGLSNPVTYGHRNDWLTAKKEAEHAAQSEGVYAKSLPRTFILTEKKLGDKAFAAAKNPVQPLRPARYLNEDGSRATRTESPPTAIVPLPGKRVPPAKRSHMDGVLRGVPGGSEVVQSTQQRTYLYDDEMRGMNREKDTEFHRKRDAYSDYVEARARFSKMHSVT